jgi:hypothetical protein
VCLPVVADRGPFRDLPRKLTCDQDLQACCAKGKLHTSPPEARRTVADFNTNIVTVNTEIEKRLSNPILLSPLSWAKDFCDLRSMLNYTVTVMNVCK